MGIFSKVKSAARTFGERVFGKATKEESARLRRESDTAKAREERARREANDLARQARELSTPRARAGAATRADEQESQRRRQKVMELAKQERLAREESQRAKSRAEELRRQAENMERDAVRQEASRNKAREAYLRTRKNLPPEQWDETFQGPRPAAPRIDKNRKEVGVGTLPDEKAFLFLGMPMSRFASSNVDTIQYDLSKKALYIRYIKSMRWYKYSGVPKEIAVLAYQAASKGIFTWDNIRIRGTRKGHKYPYSRGTAPPDYLPLDPTSSAAQFAMRGGGL